MEPREQKAHLQTILKAAHVNRDKIELEFRGLLKPTPTPADLSLMIFRYLMRSSVSIG